MDRDPDLAPAGPTLFLLDEFAALGRLEAVERAMGLMAGYGLQLWPILQDLSQLKGLYGPKANTFVANAGVLQTFGVNDLETAEWLSRSLGRETIATETRSQRAGDDPGIFRQPHGAGAPDPGRGDAPALPPAAPAAAGPGADRGAQDPLLRGAGLRGALHPPARPLRSRSP